MDILIVLTDPNTDQTCKDTIIYSTIIKLAKIMFDDKEASMHEHMKANTNMQSVGIHYLNSLHEAGEVDEDFRSDLMANDLTGIAANVTVRELVLEHGLEEILLKSKLGLTTSFIMLLIENLQMVHAALKDGCDTAYINKVLGDRYPVVKEFTNKKQPIGKARRIKRWKTVLWGIAILLLISMITVAASFAAGMFLFS